MFSAVADCIIPGFLSARAFLVSVAKMMGIPYLGILVVPYIAVLYLGVHGGQLIPPVSSLGRAGIRIWIWIGIWRRVRVWIWVRVRCRIRVCAGTIAFLI